MHMNCLNVFLADAAAAPAGGSAGGTQQNPLMALAPFILLPIIFYFFLIRPQQQRTKQQNRLLSALKAGDRVVTSSGIVGVVITVREKAVPPSVSIRSADAKFEITKASITEILADSAATES
jgi:preprotein translocase subunit YajC